MRTQAAFVATLLIQACSWSPPAGTVIVEGPQALEAELTDAVEVWASEGAAIEVGQVGPCDAAKWDECRRNREGDHWRMVLVEDGTLDPAGAPLCVVKADGGRTFASTDYDSQTITVGECLTRLAPENRRLLLAHELGHILLGDVHDAQGIMAAEPADAEFAPETQERACALGWGC